MSNYAEKKDGWPSQYASPPPNPGYGGYQQPQQQYGQYQPNAPSQYPQGASYAQSAPYSQDIPYQQPPPGYQQPPYSQNQYGAPPQGYGAPPQGYGAPPQSYGTAPSPQGYGSAPPPQGYGAAPPPQGYNAAPPPQSYNSAPLQAHPAPPSQQQPAYPQQPQSEKRHSVVFKFSGTNATILNSQVNDPLGKSPFHVSTPTKKVTSFRAADGAVIALIDWDHSSPVMEFRGKKIKIKEWLPLKKDDKTSRTFVHEGKHYDWITRDQTVYLEPSDRPGHHIAIWRDPTGVTELEVFQEALVTAGMLEACLLAVVLMQSGNSLGDGSSGSYYPSVGIAIGTVIGGLLSH